MANANEIKPEILIGIKPAPLDAILSPEWSKEARALLALYTAAPRMHAALKRIVEACRTTEYREPLSPAQIADIANAELALASPAGARNED